MSLLPQASYVFGNGDELKAFATLRAWPTDGDLLPLAQKLADLLGPRGTAVITQGALDTLVALQGMSAFSISVPPVRSEEIIDTNGCGDAFVGGFLAKVAHGENWRMAVDEGHRCAGHVLRRRGCDLTH